MATLTFTADEFKAYDDAARDRAYKEEIKYDLNNVLAKYGQDKFGRNAGTKQQKIVYEKWVSSLNDQKIIEKLKNGAIDSYPVKTYANWASEYSTGTKSLADPVANNFPSVEEYLETLIDALGFVEYFNQNSGFLTTGDEIASVNDLESLTGNQLNTLKQATAAALGIETKTPSTEEQRSLRQCALFSDLLHRGYSYSTYPSTWTTNGDNNNKAFKGRIYPVDIKKLNTSFDPNMLMNTFIVPKNVREYLSNESTNKNNFLSWDLFWIYRDANGLNETKIQKSAGTLKANQKGEDDPVYAALKDKGFITDQIDNLITGRVKNHKYSITSVSVSFDGTNPATARNDVKVDISFSLDHISSLNTPCAIAEFISQQQAGAATAASKLPERGGLAMVKIRDLITISQNKVVDIYNPFQDKDGTMTYQATSYVPETSRIRLKVWYNEGTDSTDPLKTSVALITDLSIIDHTIERTNDENNPCTLNISYRGYFEEVMNAPYNDALTDISMINNRIRRADNIKTQAKSGCSDKLVRQLQKVQEEEHRIEVEAFHKNGGLLKRLRDEGLLYSYGIDATNYETARLGNSLDLTVGNIISQGSITSTNLTLQQIEDLMKKEKIDYADQTQATTNRSNIVQSIAYAGTGYGSQGQGLNFSSNTQRAPFNYLNQKVEFLFYLGDLMEILLDCLYFDDTAVHYPHTQDLNLRFIVGSIEVPDPKDTTKTIVINPLQIPIDLAFFASWYHDTIVKKGVQSYAIGPFIKDLIERLINDVLYDNCFTLLQIDEAAPQLRSTFLSDYSNTWFNTFALKEGNLESYWFDPEHPFTQNVEPTDRLAIMKRDISGAPGSSHNYCVIYQQFPSFYRQKISANSNSQFKDNKYVPSLFDGYKSTEINYCANVSFSKVESNSYLREARYFNNSFGRLALLSNVYNLTFEIQNLKMNTFFYPGNILNFIVSDFAEDNITASSDAWTAGKLGKADPHKNNTLPNILGLGGYFIVTKVTYTLNPNQSEKSHAIKIETRFVGTDARIPIVGGTENANPFANEPKNCETVFNNAVDSLRVKEGVLHIDAADFTHIRTESNTYSTPTSLPQTSRVFSVPSGGGTSIPSALQAFAQNKLKNAGQEETVQVSNGQGGDSYIAKFKEVDTSAPAGVSLETWILTKKGDTSVSYEVNIAKE